MVALLVSESEERFISQPFFAGIVGGVSSAITGSQRQLLLLAMAQSDDEPQRLVAGPRHRHRRRVRGLGPEGRGGDAVLEESGRTVPEDVPPCEI
ncbi:MAG TPA: hypothetical protein VKB14_07795 [Actinomycetales bacterium]|nr:hypothetical protein [Actinomycetales bacterium]